MIKKVIGFTILAFVSLTAFFFISTQKPDEICDCEPAEHSEKQVTEFTEEQREKIDGFEKISLEKWPLESIQVTEAYICIYFLPEIYENPEKVREISKSIAIECAQEVGFRTVSYVVFKDEAPFWFSYYETKKQIEPVN